MTPVERELIEKISRLNIEKQRRVLDYVNSLEELQPEKIYSARELMQLPLHERNLMVAQALERSTAEETDMLDAYDEADFDDE